MVDIEAIKKEYQKLLDQLADPELISNWGKGDEFKDSSSPFAGARVKGDESKDSSSPFAGARVFEELLKRKKELEKIIEKEKEIEDLEKQAQENKAILSSGENPELTSLAEEEIKTLSKKEEVLKKELEELLKKGKSPEVNSVVIEIRAGTGGEEAAIFVADLFKMYSKYGELQGWKQRVLDSNPTELGGFKEIFFELRGEGVFSRMKWEGGVHRVQRIPTTEKSGRIHTSTVSVAVLPKPKESEVKIRPEDLKVDVYKSSGPGGQYVNKRETAVRITHLPTGIIVASQTERNLQQNRENAMAILEAKILEEKMKQEEEKLGEKRKAQIGWAKRAEKIRTYNFPQDRITDHRIKKSWRNLEKILNGELNPVIDALGEKEEDN